MYRIEYRKVTSDGAGAVVINESGDFNILGTQGDFAIGDTESALRNAAFMSLVQKHISLSDLEVDRTVRLRGMQQLNQPDPDTEYVVPIVKWLDK